MARVYNFSAGPSMLPESVLKKAQSELLEYGSSGQSVMEMSHRSSVYDGILRDAQDTLRRVLSIPDNYKIGFFQGGASTQFAMPTTAQITPMTFAEKYAEYDAAGVEELLYVSINGGGSATCANARFAAEQYAAEHPGSALRVTIVDSHTYSMAYGRFVLRAAEKLAAGAEMSDVVTYLNDNFKKVQVVLSVHSLKIIKRSGRISAAAAFAGELMGLRPVITILQGETKVVQKVRGDAKVLPALAGHLKTHAGEAAPYMLSNCEKICPCGER